MPQLMTLKIDKIDDMPGGVRRLSLCDPDRWRLPPVRPGAHIELHIPDVGTRIYSLCGDPSVEHEWQIAVKRAETSRGGSVWLHHNLTEGAIVYTSFPRTGFKIVETATRHIMVAGGIGITPFLSMAHVLERLGLDWQLHVVHRGPMEIVQDYKSWIDKGKLRTYETSSGNRPALRDILGSPDASVAAYCCGPQPMIDAFQELTLDWADNHAQIEYFLPPKLAPVADARPYTVELKKSGLTTEVGSGETLLKALIRVGKKIDSSCEGGICGVCELAWLQGEPVHRDLILSPERRKTHLLSCVSGCASERLVIDL